MTIASILVIIGYMYVLSAFIYLEGSILATRQGIEWSLEEQDPQYLVAAHRANSDATWFSL